MLSRNLQFMGQYEFPVIVVDGSDLPFRGDSALAKNITYFHRPDSIYGSFKRILFALEQVSTPYVSLVPDDDFMLPSAQRACVDYLIEMPDYVACAGRALFYEEHPDGVFLREAFPGYRDKDFYYQSSLRRLDECFSNYDVFHYWSVVRLEVLRKAMALACHPISTNVQQEETVAEFAVCALGKSKVINHLRWIRSRSPQLDWKGGVPDENNYYSFSGESKIEKVAPLAGLLLDELDPFLEGASSRDVIQIMDSLNSDAGRITWFGDVSRPPLGIRVKQFIKNLIGSIDFSDRFEANNRKEISSLKSQLTKIDEGELNHVLKILKSDPLNYQVQ